MSEHPENTKCVGPFYAAWLRPSDRQPLISTAWTHEIEEPWRSGRGLAFRIAGRLLTVGVWWRGTAPSEEEHDLGIATEIIREW